MILDKLVGKSLRKLAKDIQEFEKKLRRAASDTAVDAAIQTVRRLAWATPVDTSKALSNWRATAGFPATTAIPPYYPGDYGSTQAASVQATVERAMESLARKNPGQMIYITNNVSYMEYLAKGSSREQQPKPGWIERIGSISEKQWKFKHPVL